MGKQISNPGGLKKVPAGNKGLGKLPTQVRNKMGFLKEGGTVEKYSNGGSVKSKGAAKGGIKIRGAGAATKGFMARGPMG